MVWKANNVWVQNLTACNFLAGSGTAGNEIWWNGGDGSGKIGGWGYNGSYLNATSTFYKDESTAMAVRDLLQRLERRDLVSGLRQQLQRFRLLHRRLPAGVQPDARPRLVGVQRARLLGLELRRPAGGQELPVRQQPGRVRHQQPERRRPPRPRTAPAPTTASARSPTPTHAGCSWTTTCTTTTTPTCPGVGLAAAGPVGTGISISGARNDTVMDNRFVNNGAWGTIFVPYPGHREPPSDAPNCAGGVGGPGNVCLLRRLGQRDAQQHLHAQRVLRQPTPTATSPS